MTDGHYKATDILSGKASAQQIERRSVIVWGVGKGESLIQAINVMATEGWVVRQCWLGAIALAGPVDAVQLLRVKEKEQERKD